MVYILLGKGFEEIEAVAPCDILRRGGVAVHYAAVGASRTVEGAHGITITAELSADSISPEKGDIFVVPGGMGGVDSIKADKEAMALLEKAAACGCDLAAICAGPSVLADLSLLDGKQITCYPGCENMMGKALCSTELSTNKDGSIITARAPGSAIDFGLALLSHIAGKQAADRVRRELVY